MKKCDGCGADLEQGQPHDQGCAERDADERTAHENEIATCRKMAREHGSKFATCACGRKRVLMYRRAEKWPQDCSSNGPRSDRLTHHNTPEGFSCTHGGALVADVAGAAMVTL